MKNMHWFKHDRCASLSTQMARLLEEEGSKGYGTYWYIIEMLCMQTDHKADFTLLYSIRRKGFSIPYMKKIITYFGLFVVEENTFSSVICFGPTDEVSPPVAKSMQEIPDTVAKRKNDLAVDSREDNGTLGEDLPDTCPIVNKCPTNNETNIGNRYVQQQKCISLIDNGLHIHCKENSLTCTHVEKKREENKKITATTEKKEEEEKKTVDVDREEKLIPLEKHKISEFVMQPPIEESTAHLSERSAKQSTVESVVQPIMNSQSFEIPHYPIRTWQELINDLNEDSSWADMACMKSGYGGLLKRHFKDAVEYFRRHIVLYDKGRQLFYQDNMRQYFVNFVSPGSRTSAELHKYLSTLDANTALPDTYRYERIIDGKRTYGGQPIPNGAPPRPDDTSVWNNTLRRWVNLKKRHTN